MAAWWRHRRAGHERMAGDASLAVEGGNRGGAYPGASGRRTSTRPVIEMGGVSNDRLNGSSTSASAPGEILGLAGKIGSGRTEILETIFGLRRVDEGEVPAGGRRRRPEQAGGRDPARSRAGARGPARVRPGPGPHHRAQHRHAPTAAAHRGGRLYQGRGRTTRAEAAVADLNIKRRPADTGCATSRGATSRRWSSASGATPHRGCSSWTSRAWAWTSAPAKRSTRMVRAIRPQRMRRVVASSELDRALQLSATPLAIVHDGRITARVPSAVEGEERLHHLVQETDHEHIAPTAAPAAAATTCPRKIVRDLFKGDRPTALLALSRRSSSSPSPVRRLLHRREPRRTSAARRRWSSIMAVGMACMIISAEIDLSVASILELSGVSAALACATSPTTGCSARWRHRTGALVGLVNGLLTTRARHPVVPGDPRHAGRRQGLALVDHRHCARAVDDQHRFWAVFAEGSIAGIPASDRLDDVALDRRRRPAALSTFGRKV